VLVECSLDDLWVRDSGCVFVHDDAGERAGVDFNFNGWGDKQTHGRDAAVAAFMTERANVAHLRSRLVLEGGAIEVDGAGTAVLTESCVLNDNRNPGLGKAAVERTLQETLGLQKIIWLPGIAGQDITDGHTDFYARFVCPGVVVAGLDNDPQSFDYAVTRRHLDILRRSTDAAGRPLEVVVLQAPTQPRNSHHSRDFAAGYINFYVCNGAVIAPEFGDRAADEAAHSTLARLFPGRQVVPVAIDAIAAGGGGIHCATQQEPR
jgi:agmatine deiminase